MSQKAAKVERINFSLIRSFHTATPGSCREQMTWHHQHTEAQWTGMLLTAQPPCCQGSGERPEPASNSCKYSHGYWRFSAWVFPQPLSKFVVGRRHYTAHNVTVSQAVNENQLYHMNNFYIWVTESALFSRQQPAWTANLHSPFSLSSRSSSIFTSWTCLGIWTRLVLIY